MGSSKLICFLKEKLNYFFYKLSKLLLYRLKWITQYQYNLIDHLIYIYKEGEKRLKVKKIS